MLTPSSRDSASRLSTLGRDSPCCHLYTACGYSNPKYSCTWRTDSPRFLR